MKTVGASKVTINLPRPCEVHAGYYYYVWMPISLPSIFQMHPFVITSWENNLNGEAVRVSFLVRSRSGFTGKLLHSSISSSQGYLTWIDGPYGSSTNINGYGCVLMYASGIGIAAQLSYVKEFVEGCKQNAILTQHILLVWEIDDEGE